MADIEIRRAHNLGLKAARAAADKMAEHLGTKFGLQGGWEGNTLQLRASRRRPARSRSTTRTCGFGDPRVPAEGDEGLDRGRGDVASWTSSSRRSPLPRQRGEKRLSRKRPRRARKKAVEDRGLAVARRARGSRARRPSRGTPRSRARGNPAGLPAPRAAPGRRISLQRAEHERRLHQRIEALAHRRR